MIVNWDSRVNKTILRDGTSWNNIVGFKEDETRSGRTKRRLFGTLQKRVFFVKMHFTLDEYMIFNAWYENEVNFGLHSFYFPRIDSDVNVNRVYRFSVDGSPQFSNPSGEIIECTMKWEEE